MPSFDDVFIGFSTTNRIRNLPTLKPQNTAKGVHRQKIAIISPPSPENMPMMNNANAPNNNALAILKVLI
jgi:hypothetical protein